MVLQRLVGGSLERRRWWGMLSDAVVGARLALLRHSPPLPLPSPAQSVHYIHHYPITTILPLRARVEPLLRVVAERSVSPACERRDWHVWSAKATFLPASILLPCRKGTEINCREMEEGLAAETWI